MKRTIALLLAGLVSIGPAAAQTTAPTGTGQQDHLKVARSGDDRVTLNFSNIDIAALVKVMSEFTRKNFILDEKVTGKVTLMTPTKISPEEAYQVFLSALEIKGFTAVEDGKIIRIVSTAAVRQSGVRVLQDGDMAGEGYVTKLLRLTYVNPQDIVRTLTPLITKDGNLIAYPATNSVIITDSVSAIRKIEQLVAALDVSTPAGKGKINVYYLRHASAEDIAKVMQALVSRLPTAPAAGSAAPAGPATILEGAVTITADKLTNALIIVGSPGDYETVKDVIQKLDIRRRQVYVEAAIIEMSLTKSRELGFEFQAANFNKLDPNKTSIVGGTNFGGIGPATALGPAAFAASSGLAVGAVKGTFTYGGKEFLNIGALLRALQSDSDVNVLSTPNILTSDNQKAEIMVGQNVPFTTGQTQNATTGSGSIFNTVERKDVGIKLSILPQISSDDNVRLDVNQEISDVVAASFLNPTGLVTNKREAKTTVVVKDRETMVIAGLIRDNLNTSETKVPLLGDIPLLGWLFKYKTTKLEKTNLMIFITPYIIKNEQDAEAITRRNNELQEEFRKQQQFEKKPASKLMKENVNLDGEPKAGVIPPVASPGEGQKEGSGTAAPAGVDQPAPAERSAAPPEGAR